MEVLGARMEFEELVDQARRVEKSAGEKKPYSGEVELPKTIDFSPEEFVDDNYQDLLNEYGRMIRVAKASGIRFKEFAAKIERPQAQTGPAPELKVVQSYKPQQLKAPAKGKPEPPPKAAPKAAQKAEKKPLTPPVLAPPPIPPAPSSEPRKAKEEKEELDFDFEGTDAPARKEEEKKASGPKEKPIVMPPPLPKMAAPPAAEPAPPAPKHHELEFEREPQPRHEEMEEKEELGIEPSFEFGKEEEKPPEPRPPSPPELKTHAELAQMAREAIGEASEIPYLERHESVSLIIPPLLSTPPEQAAESKYAEVEAKVPTALTPSSEAEMKKRIVELTKQLFREKNTAQRQKLKEEIAEVTQMLSRKAELPKRAVSYATSFYNTMEVAQKMELMEAKHNITSQYKSQLERTLSSFSSALKIAKGAGERKAIYDTLVSDMDALKAQIEALSDKYESFLLREHTLELEKVKNLASLKGDRYVSEKAGERVKEIKFTYASEFLALEDSVRKELASLAKTRQHEALETRMSSETEEVLAIANMPEQELLTYMHAHQEAKYREFENGTLSKLELLSLARRLMAKESGIKNDIINKYFGEI